MYPIFIEEEFKMNKEQLGDSNNNSTSKLSRRKFIKIGSATLTVTILGGGLFKLFSPKQKELVLKKYNGEPLTKTEQEYYSRVVKKKIGALANSELRRIATVLAKK